MRLEKIPCPCGCRKFLVTPLIGCQCGTLHGSEADELVRRWNAFEDAKTTHVTRITTGHGTSDLGVEVVFYNNPDGFEDGEMVNVVIAKRSK